MRETRFVFLSVVLVLAIFFAGCHAAPKSMPDPDKLATAPASEYWKADRVPQIRAGAKLAILEFSVEYVTEKIESPTESQPEIFAADYGAAGFVLTSAGVGKKTLSLDKELMASLPNEFYSVFVDELREAGYEVVPTETLRAAKSFKYFKSFKPGFSHAGQRLNPMGADTGNIKATKVHPADGLIVLKNAGRMRIADAEASLAQELGADAVMRVRFRVGLFRGRPTIEAGSKITVTTIGATGSIHSTRSIVSEKCICEKGSFRFFRGLVYTPDVAQYRECLVPMFPWYSRMAVGSFAQAHD
jgi:hypothetical protein